MAPSAPRGVDPVIETSLTRFTSSRGPFDHDSRGPHPRHLRNGRRNLGLMITESDVHKVVGSGSPGGFPSRPRAPYGRNEGVRGASLLDRIDRPRPFLNRADRFVIERRSPVDRVIGLSYEASYQSGT
ncbi:hypothetical protein GCM10009535_47100 [Streptomyces thermocarboxydovorans]|uniref:Uncharacterized protein n=1 Tax=Streptomyces thermocarboxydovorans TaxID=59298 RepID=A0ABN1HPP0_9ACTN